MGVGSQRPGQPASAPACTLASAARIRASSLHATHARVALVTGATGSAGHAIALDATATMSVKSWLTGGAERVAPNRSTCKALIGAATSAEPGRRGHVAAATGEWERPTSASTNAGLPARPVHRAGRRSGIRARENLRAAPLRESGGAREVARQPGRSSPLVIRDRGDARGPILARRRSARLTRARPWRWRRTHPSRNRPSLTDTQQPETAIRGADRGARGGDPPTHGKAGRSRGSPSSSPPTTRPSSRAS